MPSINLSFVSDTRAAIKSKMSSVITGEVKSGKEVVREDFQRLSEKQERRLERLLAKFVEEKGKGGRIDMSI